MKQTRDHRADRAASVADRVLFLGGHVRKGAGVALGREQGVVAEAFGPGPL